MLDMLNCAEQYTFKKQAPKKKKSNDKTYVLITMLKKPEAMHYVLKRQSKTHTSQLYNRIMKVHTSLH